MPNHPPYPAELRGHVVRLVLDRPHKYRSQWGAICSVAERLGAFPLEPERLSAHHFGVSRLSSLTKPSTIAGANGLEVRAVPGTSLRLPRVALGAMTFGGQADEQASREMLDMALDAGANLLDTANTYANGASEETLGRLLEGRREAVILATKVGAPRGAEGPPLAPDELRGSLIRSLQRLKTDYVDIYYFHRPDPVTPVEESLAAAYGLVDEGLIRHLGVSNHASWQIVEMQCIAQRLSKPPIRISQPVYNLLARRIEDEYVSCTSQRGVVNVIYNPLAGGLLTGKYRADRGPQRGTRFAEKRTYRERYWNRVQLESVGELADIADSAGFSLPELALRWLLSKPHVDTILLGASRPDQLRVNLDACTRGALTHEVERLCDRIWPRLGGVAPSYSQAPAPAQADHR